MVHKLKCGYHLHKEVCSNITEALQAIGLLQQMIVVVTDFGLELNRRRMAAGIRVPSACKHCLLWSAIVFIQTHSMLRFKRSHTFHMHTAPANKTP